MVKSIFKLIRWPNILITALTILAIKYFVFKSAILHYFSESQPQMDLVDTLLLILSVSLIAAAGYIINDIYDIKEDAINKPNQQIINQSISVKTGKILYYTFNISGIILASWLGKQLGNYQLAIQHIVASALLWVYSVYLSKSTLVGNIVIAIVSALVPLTYFLYESLPYVVKYKFILLEVYTTTLGGPVRVLINFCLTLSGFAFLLSLCREIIKDMQDVHGDTKFAGKTLPIVIGINNTKKIANGIAIATTLLIIYILHFVINFAPFNHILFICYVYLTIILPLIFFIYSNVKAVESSDFKMCSTILKLVMLSGILSTYFYNTLI